MPDLLAQCAANSGREFLEMAERGLALRGCVAINAHVDVRDGKVFCNTRIRHGDQRRQLLNKVTLQQIGYFALEQTCNAFGTDTHGGVRDVRRRRVPGHEGGRSHWVSNTVAARLILPASASLR